LQTNERRLLIATAAAALLLRVPAFFRYRFDSDEQQHLHVVWGWTAGLVQYRDLFDNHLPLFHLLMAPLLALLGERPDILHWMRVPMLLIFAVIIGCTYLVAMQLYDRRVALWSATLLAIFPPFFLKSLEFRPDNLWTAFWMLALAGIVRGWRPILIGILLGCALATSSKSAILIIAITLGGALTLLLLKRRPRGIAEGLAGLILVPGAVATWFYFAGALDDLIRCNFVFNAAAAGMRRFLWIGQLLFPILFVLIAWRAWRARAGGDPWRLFLGITLAIHVATLISFWPLISPRDFLAMMPVAAILAAAALTQLPLRATAIYTALSVIALWHYGDRFENRTRWHTTMLEQALRLTRPGENIIDIKGETIYRRRPFYYAFENVGRTMIAHGNIEDTLPEDVIRTRTYVAQADGPMWSPRARAFLSDNFVNVGRLRVAGQWISSDGSFTIAIPGRYVVLDEHGLALGVLDGRPQTGPRSLEAGTHRFNPRDPRKRCVVVWAPAWQRGHSPFHLRDTEF
jgi:hypothetical protein